MRSLLLGKYIEGDSILHKLDPRSKLALLLAIVTILFLASTIRAQVTILCFIMILNSAASIPSRAIMSLFKGASLFVMLTLLVHFFFSSQESDFKFGFIQLSYDGFRIGIFYSLRLLSMIWMAALISWTTQPIAFADSIEKLLAPLARYKFKVREFSTMILLALRFIPTLTNDARDLKFAQKARGASFGRGSPITRIKSVLPLVVPLFVGALRRADSTAIALTVRGFSSESERTSLHPIRISLYDYFVISLSALVILLGLYNKFAP